MNYTKLKIDTKQAEDILHQLYNIGGVASELPGDTDFNFKIKVDDEVHYILKISRPNTDEDVLDFQEQLLNYLNRSSEALIPKLIHDSNGNTVSEYTDENGKLRKVRLLTWISGRLWSQVNPQLNSLRFSLGQQCGILTKALKGFSHKQAHRSFEWDVAQSLWTKEYLHLFSNDQKEILSYFISEFEKEKNDFDILRKSIVHNDANDNNIIVSEDLVEPRVKAIIDFGDATHTQIINDLAIACAYAIMEHNDPLDAALPIVSGYHESFPLQEEELRHLYNCIAMRLVISVTKSAISKTKEPENEYLLISEKPAWELLKKWRGVSSDFAHFSFRVACGYGAHPDTEKFKLWASKNQFKVSDLFPTAPSDDFQHIDLSVSSTWMGHEKEFNDLDLFQFKIDKLQAKHPRKVLAGGYLEPRPIYTSTAYDKIGNNGRESRTIHLGIDFWFPANTPVHALFDGEVVIAVDDEGDQEEKDPQREQDRRNRQIMSETNFHMTSPRPPSDALAGLDLLDLNRTVPRAADLIGNALATYTRARTQGQHDGTDHGDEQDHPCRLEQVDVAGVDDIPQRGDIAAQSRIRRRCGGNGRRLRGDHPGTDHHQDFHQQDEGHQQTDGQVLQEPLPQFDEVDAFDDTTVFDVEARDDTGDLHRVSIPPAASVVSASSASSEKASSRAARVDSSSSTRERSSISSFTSPGWGTMAMSGAEIPLATRWSRSRTKSALSYPLSAPSVSCRVEPGECAWIMSSAAFRSAWPSARGRSPCTIRPARSSISAWHMRHSTAPARGDFL